jgi:hypothetical protein
MFLFFSQVSDSEAYDKFLFQYEANIPALLEVYS